MICTREAGSVFEGGGLTAVLTFIRENGWRVHKDTLHSAMAVVSRLCTKMEPQDTTLPAVVEALSILLKHEDSHVRTIESESPRTALVLLATTHACLYSSFVFHRSLTEPCAVLHPYLIGLLGAVSIQLL